ncbi:MAG: hypothetical protein ABI567_07540 [Gammaproteobacteria bacterium]
MGQVSGIAALDCRPFLRTLAASAICVLLAAALSGEAFATTPAGASIRSAQIFARDEHWQRVAPRAPRDEQAEIRAHFAAVRQALTRDTETSLDTAVARFEDAYQLSLTPDNRAALRNRLAARRDLQLERLQDYALAGSFPLNRHYAGEARPIFVDARGTHCAVGHLMALDGREADVLAIARATPNVLVREVARGPLVSWVLASGLVQEEAALIQPAYFPPSPAAATNLGALIVSGGSLDRNGFRYENFAFSASGTGGAATPGAAQFGLVYGWPPTAPGVFCPGGSSCAPTPDTFWFGVFQSPTAFGYLYTGANQTITIAINYDVVALAADLGIGGTRTFASSLYGGFMNYGSPSGPTASLSTTLESDGLDRLVLDLPSTSAYTFEPSGSLGFAAPATSAHVQHTIQFSNGTSFGSFDSTILRATIVPLPGTIGLLGLSLVVISRFGRRALRRK